MKKPEIKTFEGNYFEIGEQHGKIYKKNGMDIKNIKVDQVLYKNQLDVYKKYYPELLEEFRGIAIGLNLDEEKVINFFITNEIKEYSKIGKACTIFGFKTNKSLYVGRNYDWLPKTEEFFQIYKVYNPQKNSFIAVTDGAYGAEAGLNVNNFFYNVDDAINDKGLFIGLTFAYADEWSYGLTCIHMTKLIAETCATVEEAIKVFEKVPLCCPKNFFIADKKGDMVIIEHTSKKFKILRPKENILIQTNHYVDKELEKDDTVLKRIPYHNTFLRYYETLQGINFKQKKFNHNSIIKILGRKGSYTCQNFPGVKTIWSLALDIQREKYTLFYDHFGTRKQINLKIKKLK